MVVTEKKNEDFMEFAVDDETAKELQKNSKQNIDVRSDNKEKFDCEDIEKKINDKEEKTEEKIFSIQEIFKDKKGECFCGWWSFIGHSVIFSLFKLMNIF